MNNFSSLNNLPSISYEDLRVPGVVTDVPRARNVSANQTQTQFDVINTIEIIDIIRPDLALVRYEIDVSDTGIIDVDWGLPLPAGTSVNRVGSRFTISGVDSVATWDLIKNPTITLPTGYQGNTFYDVSIVYNTDVLTDQRITWTVGEYIPQVLLESEFTQAIEASRVRKAVIDLRSYSTMIVVPKFASLFADFDITPNINYTASGIANLLMSSVQTTNASYFTGFDAVLNSTASLDYLDNLVNHKQARDYQSNNKNNIFALNPVQIAPTLPADTYTMTFSSTNGNFAINGSGTITDLQSITGSKSSVNNQVNNIDYYPDLNYTGTDTLMIALYASNGNLIEKYLTPISYAGASTLTETFTFSSTTTGYSFAPVYNYYYDKVDLLLVGGGASGAAGYSIGTNNNAGTNTIIPGAGGAGGGVFYQTGVSSDFTNSYTFSVGNGGTINKSLWSSQRIQSAAGTSTTGFGVTATGGQSNGAVTARSGNSGYPSINGSTTGTSGAGDYNGGAGAGQPSANVDFYYGGNPGGYGLTTPLGIYGGGGGGANGYKDAEQFYDGSTFVNQSPNKNLGGDGGGGQGATLDNIDPDYATYISADDGIINTGGGGGGAAGGFDTDDIDNGYTVYGEGPPGNGGSGFIKFTVKLK